MSPNVSMKSSPRRMLVLSLLAALCAVGAIAAALYTVVARNRESAVWVEHTHQILKTVALLQEHVEELEATQRGYLLSPSEDFSKEREHAAASLESDFVTLKRLSDEDVSQSTGLRGQLPQVEQELKAILETERLSRTLPPGQARSAIFGESARQRVGALEHSLDAAEAEQVVLLRGRRQHEEATMTAIMRTLAATCILGVVLIAWACVVYRRKVTAHADVERRFGDLVQALPVAVWQLRENRKGPLAFEFISENAGPLCGVDVPGAMQASSVVTRAILPEDRRAVGRALRASRSTGHPLLLDYRIRTQDGHIRWIRCGAIPRREDNGTLLWNGYWADVTDQVDMQQALALASDEAVSANRAKSNFLASMSHEIRTPMNGVLGLLEIVSLTPLDSEQRTMLGVVQDSGRALLHLVDDILDFSKIEAGRLDLNPVPSSIHDVVRRACDTYRGAASGKGLLLHAQVDPRVRNHLVFDPLRVAQVLNNFLNNAVKFTAAGSIGLTVEVTAESEQAQHLKFSIRDPGIGISEAALQGLFQPYAQAEPGTAGKFGGTGLGLVICRRLASLMGGTVSLSSATGAGTTATLELMLPVADAAAIEAFARAVEPAAASTLGRTAPGIDEAAADGTLLLIVDDHPVNRMVLKQQANLLGYAAVTAEDGAQGLKAWQGGGFGAVLADCNMPNLNGYEMATAIRAIEKDGRLVRIPIIACTANAHATEAQRCMDAGMDDCLVKPLNLADLAERLQRWLPLTGSTTGSAHTPMNHSLLDAICAGSESVKADFLADFRDFTRQDAIHLRACAAHEDFDQIVHFAHRIRGCCVTVGAGSLARACQKLEKAGRNLEAADLPQALLQFEEALGFVEQDLSVLLRDRAPSLSSPLSLEAAHATP